jgi:hypothetical protein
MGRKRNPTGIDGYTRRRRLLAAQIEIWLQKFTDGDFCCNGIQRAGYPALTLEPPSEIFLIQHPGMRALDSDG